MGSSIKQIALRVIHYTTKVIYAHLPISIPELVSGPGTVNRLPELIKSSRANRILIVTDKGLTSIGLIDQITEPLKTAQIPFTLYDGVQPNPSIQNIEDGLKLYLENKCNGIVAFGGGSPMDCAKMIGARASNPKKSVSKMRGKLRVWRKLPPLIAIPTTAGTGSETTAVAVVSDPVSHEKFTVMDLKLVPPLAILDPELMLTLPPHITSSTGMDALTHAVEAYIGIHGTKFTRENSEKATKIIMDNLECAYKEGTNLETRHQLSLASFYAGVAFTRAFVGYAHAIAHHLGGLYGVPHGVANAIVLPYVLEASREHAKKKLARLALVSGLGKESDSADVLSKKFIEKIKEMNRNMDIPTVVKELREKDIHIIAKRALAEADIDYPVPRIMSKKELSELIGRMLSK